MFANVLQMFYFTCNHGLITVVLITHSNKLHVDSLMEVKHFQRVSCGVIFNDHFIDSLLFNAVLKELKIVDIG